MASIISGDTMTLPRGDAVIRRGDRVIVIGSPQAALAWSEILAPDEAKVEDVVVYGAGHVGKAVARHLLDRGIGVRIVESNAEQARLAAEEIAGARVYRATGIDPDFLERERIGHAQAAIFAMREDERNLYAATMARVHGVPFTIAIVHDPVSREVYEASGVDVTVNPRQVTAEEIVRFAHDPRTQQVAMLEGDRYEVLDLTTQADERVRRPPLPRDADPRRADRRDRARRSRDLSPRRGRARGRRPRDRVHRVLARPDVERAL